MLTCTVSSLWFKICYRNFLKMVVSKTYPSTSTTHSNNDKFSQTVPVVTSGIKIAANRSALLEINRQHAQWRGALVTVRTLYSLLPE